MEALRRLTGRLPTLGNTQIPDVFLKPLAQFEQDSGVLPGISGALRTALGNLPRLPFERRLKSALEGKIEEAIPPMPWEGK